MVSALTKVDAADPWIPSPLSVGVVEGIGDFVLRFLNRGILCRFSHCNLDQGKLAVLCPWDCSASSTLCELVILVWSGLELEVCDGRRGMGRKGCDPGCPSASCKIWAQLMSSRRRVDDCD